MSGWVKGVVEKFVLCITLFSAGVLFPLSSMAHTTILFPQTGKDGMSNVKIIHFHPATGSGLMGIRLGVDDSNTVKGLESIFYVHEGQRRMLSDVVTPDNYTVRSDTRETYSIPVNRDGGFFRPGDYILVVKHIPHWKPNEGMYRQKVTKYCLNLMGVMTDWPERVLTGMPEIVPLVQPHGLTAGSLFRAEVVNDDGEYIPNAKIAVEYLNYAAGTSELDTSGKGFLSEEAAEFFVFTDRSGSFSFIPPRKGVWTFTLVDGDANRTIDGKILEFDSSLSIMVQ